MERGSPHAAHDPVERTGSGWLARKRSTRSARVAAGTWLTRVILPPAPGPVSVPAPVPGSVPGSVVGGSVPVLGGGTMPGSVVVGRAGGRGGLPAGVPGAVVPGV